MSNATTHIETEKQLVPTLRFDGFNSQWSKLSSPIQIVAGNAYSLDDYVDEGKMLVQGLNIGPGKLKLDSPYYISEELETKHVILKRNDILLGLNRPITNGKLKVCKYDLAEESYLYQRAGKLEFNSTEINSEFLYQLIRSNYFLKEISIELVGSDQPYIRSNLFKVVKLWFPDFPEQQKIASFLSAVDEKIQQLTKKKALLEQYKKGLTQQLFSGQLRFKDENGNPYPDWEEKRLGEVGKIVSGLTYSPDDKNEDGVLVLRSSNVHGRKVTYTDNVFVNVEKGGFNPLEENDVLICVRNGSKRLIGKNALISGKAIGVAFGAFMTVYRSASNLFLFHYFDSVNYKKEVHKNLGATINSINGSDLKKFKIPFPSTLEQQKIATYLSSIDTKIESVNNRITQTQTFKKGLLQQLFV